MTTASLLAPCNICDLKVCPGPEGCPQVIKEEIVISPITKPAIHAQKYNLKIPNDISPILQKSGITAPEDGKIFLRWETISQRIKIIILDNSKKRKDRETILHVAGNKEFRARVLHFRGNVLIKIQN